MLRTYHDQKTIHELSSMYKHRGLNLEPAFQRQSVWTGRDRQLLIKSVLDGVPLPSIYLYRQMGAGGKPKYDVIDGKQRIETILLFMGLGPLAKTEEGWVRTSFAEDDPLEWWQWGDLPTGEKNRFLTSRIATIEVEGDLGEIIDLFVRINSTGKHLTGQEKRHARFYSNPVLQTAQRLAEQYRPYFESNRLLSPGQLQRMKHVELITELLLAVNAGQPLNKKSKVDEIMAGAGLSATDLKQAAADVRRSFDQIKAILPDLKTTRFRRGSDFYTLALLVHRLRDDGKTLTLHDSARNKLAGALLRDFGLRVDEAIDRIADGKGLTRELEPYRDYVGAVRADTDSSKSRMTRERLLRRVLDHVFDDKDPARLFNATQRRIVWHASSTKVCSFCGERITRWEDMHVDHIKPHSKGGRTKLENADIAHKSCNVKAGAKRRRG